MANRPPNRDTGDDTGVRPTEDRPPGMPRWLKVSGIIVVLLILLVVGISFIAGAGCCQGVEAVARKHLRRDIIPKKAAGLRDLGQQVPDQVDYLLLRQNDMVT